MASKRERPWIGPVSLLAALALAAHPLPNWLAAFRPDWVALVMVYQAIHTPRHLILLQALIVGLLLDALHGTPLGQYALALVICVYLPLKLHLRLLLVPIWQTMLSIVLFLAIYQFVLFWANGATGNEIGAGFYVWPLISDAIIWPVVLIVLDTLRLGRRRTA